MALTEERRPGRSRDFPHSDDAPAIEPPGVAVERARHADAGKGTQKPAPSLTARMRQHPVIVAAIVIVALLVIVAGILWWLNARQYVSTDDAFIDARAVQIAPQVGGTIVGVPVTDNASVQPGALLVRIDPRDYEASLAQSEAQLEQAQANVENVDAQIDAQQANIAQAKTQVTQAQAALDFSQQQYSRAQQLLQQGAGTQQAAQQAETDLTQKKAALVAAEASETAAEKQLGVLRAQRSSALAQVDAAKATVNTSQVNLDRTTITAAQAGRIVNLKAAVGAFTPPGQAVMTLVPNAVWVTANFKETELGDMKVGDPVDISVDAYPGKTFKGHIDSIQAGSGTAFSLLPAQNATGNYVKIVQRVPVKIVFANVPDVYLGPGMSVVPTVKVR
ncbi:MAG: HlyD family secretion protein [Pseudolabrys sp.]